MNAGGFVSRETGEVRVIELKGFLDMMFAVNHGSELLHLIVSDPARDVILNVREVDLIDSYCLTMLLSLRDRLQDKGRRMAICHPRNYLRKILDLADNLDPLQIYEDESHALQAFGDIGGDRLFC